MSFQGPAVFIIVLRLRLWLISWVTYVDSPKDVKTYIELNIISKGKSVLNINQCLHLKHGYYYQVLNEFWFQS